MQEFYNDNEGFRDYVDRYCKKHAISVEKALKCAIVKQVYEYKYYCNKLIVQ